MASQLLIDDKKYYSTSVLSDSFSYTADYLSKLAREGEIDAVRVGRKWYITKEEVDAFLSKTAEEKEKRRKELQEERKRERENFSRNKNKRKKVTEKLFALQEVSVALAQTLVVITCGSLLGLLGFVAHEENLQSAFLLTATKDISETVIESVVFDQSDFIKANDQLALLDLSVFSAWLFGGSADREVVRVKTGGSNLNLIESRVDSLAVREGQKVNQSEALLVLNKDVSSSSIEKIRASFSDDVEVEFSEGGTGLIKPVFRDRTDESYRFLMVPVKGANE